MKSNEFLKLLCSIPVILIFLYFIPFLGICLILLRYFMFSNKKKIEIPITLIVFGILILIPKGLYSFLNVININVNLIPYLNDIISSEIYNIDFIKYSKFLLTVGIIFLVIIYTLKNLFNKLEKFIKSYISEEEKKNKKIYEKNDMIMKEKREKAKNTHVVHCPYCGANNIVTSETDKCQFCRRQIGTKNLEN